MEDLKLFLFILAAVFTVCVLIEFISENWKL